MKNEKSPLEIRDGFFVNSMTQCQSNDCSHLEVRLTFFVKILNQEKQEIQESQVQE